MFKKFFEKIVPQNKEEEQIKENFEEVNKLFEESLKLLES